MSFVNGLFNGLEEDEKPLFSLFVQSIIQVFPDVLAKVNAWIENTISAINADIQRTYDDNGRRRYEGHYNDEEIEVAVEQFNTANNALQAIALVFTRANKGAIVNAGWEVELWDKTGIT
jgi:hypothetical protein